MPTYIEARAFHACDTCGAPCCDKGFYPLSEGDLDEYDRAEGKTVAGSRETVQHWTCEHTNRKCRCGGVVAPSERMGDPDGDTDVGCW